MIEQKLAASLAMVARELESAGDDWWIIGSAAVALHGAEAGTVADIDVLLSETDAAILFERLGMEKRSGIPDDRFASRLFGRWEEPPLPAEFMAGTTFAVKGKRQPIQPLTRMPVVLGASRLFVPEASELCEILRAFGRPKDLVRLRALESNP
ncbi:hypothetical protein [Parerythrobacter aestuarii]|uniref:hypothetical protein n=1 Tax=Parerythrobacter aestuarii TaxID=3020909 RepID=UPI0024DE0F90|nr:hypothetical protein [Parerythrobacter aestuarii]